MTVCSDAGAAYDSDARKERASRVSTPVVDVRPPVQRASAPGGEAHHHAAKQRAAALAPQLLRPPEARESRPISARGRLPVSVPEHAPSRPGEKILSRPGEAAHEVQILQLGPQEGYNRPESRVYALRR